MVASNLPFQCGTYSDDYSRVTHGMRDKLQLIRKDDNDALFHTAAAGTGKVVLCKLVWPVPIVQPNDVCKVNLYKSIAENNVMPVSFRMRPCETFSLPQTRSTVWQLVLVLHGEKLDGYWLDCKWTSVVIRKTTQPFLITATLRIWYECG